MYQIQVATQARKDIGEAYDWLFEQSQVAADRWFIELSNAIDSLEHFPNRCPIAPESKYFLNGVLRQLLHGKYRIIFTVRDDQVMVLHVRHASRDYAQSGDITEAPFAWSFARHKSDLLLRPK
jgi:plasmid stabilization system protein ParE